jgi:post-segregation antitoxin (ccd killing protein)
MPQVAQLKSGQQRVPLGAFVDVKQHQQLAELARREDRSISSIVRRAVQAELDREGRAA